MTIKRHHAELTIETCTGDKNIVVFREEHFRDAKNLANRTANQMVKIGESGKPMSYYQDEDPNHPLRWFEPSSHLARVTVSKVSEHEGAPHPHIVHTFTCDHMAEVRA